jgi:hypothetical protein
MPIESKMSPAQAGGFVVTTTDQSPPSVSLEAAVEGDSRRADRYWGVVGMALAAKLVFFFFTAESYVILANEPLNGFKGWLSTLNRWDTVHYLNIAEHGYGATGPGRERLAFLPAYPWAIRAFSLVVPDYLISALLVSALSSVIAAVLLYRLANLDLSPDTARRSVWFLLIFPTSYFLHLAYAESLFVALVLGCILAARNQRWVDCAITGALAGFARLNGLVLIPVLACEVAEQYSRSRRFDWRFLSVASPALGFVGYLLINQGASGDPFTFLAVQREHWYKHLSVPWTGIAETMKAIRWRGPMESQMVGTQEFVFILLGLACTILCWAKLRRSYAIWMTFNWLLFTCTSFIYSVPRYTLTMFPVFMLFALAARGRVWGAAITVWSLLFLSLFTSLFVRGYWAF